MVYHAMVIPRTHAALVEPENTQTMNTQTMNTNTQMDSQKSDLNLITLERNSFNFLE